jgi:hypothetical protein
MWKRVAFIGLVLGTVASGGLWLTNEATGADTDRVIPVRATTPSEERDYAEIGDSCGVYADFPALMLTKRQIVVKDEQGTIIAVENLEGVYEKGTFDLEAQCVMDLEIDVPDAAFYTVYVGEGRITTYQADDFPIDVFDTLSIHFE